MTQNEQKQESEKIKSDAEKLRMECIGDFYTSLMYKTINQIERIDAIIKDIENKYNN